MEHLLLLGTVQQLYDLVFQKIKKQKKTGLKKDKKKKKYYTWTI